MGLDAVLVGQFRKLAARLHLLLVSMRARAGGSPGQVWLQYSLGCMLAESESRLGSARPQHPQACMRGRIRCGLC